MRHNTASFFVPMNEKTSKIEKEIQSSPEKIDGRVWLREILRRSKPRYIYAIEDKQKLEQIRKAISEHEIAFLNPEERQIPESQQIEHIKLQKTLDITRACPEQAGKFIKQERKQNARNRT